MKGVDLRRLFGLFEEAIKRLPCAICAPRLPYFVVMIDPLSEDVMFDDAPCPDLRTNGRGRRLQNLLRANRVAALGRWLSLSDVAWRFVRADVDVVAH